MIKEHLHKIGSAAIIASFLAGVLFSANFTTPAYGATNKIPDAVAAFETSLQASIGASDTTMTLVSATYNAGLSTIASSTYALVIDSGTSNEEFVLADCTGTTCTNMTRGLDGLTGTTTVSALKNAHRRGASVKLTDGPILLILNRMLQGIDTFPNVLSYQSASSLTSASSTSTQIPYVSWVFNNFLNIYTNQSVGGNKTFSGLLTFPAANIPIFDSQPTLTDDKQVATKKYVDDSSFAGGVDGSETVKGVYELSTAAEAAAGTSAGSTGARLVLPGSLASSTRQVSTTIIPITNSSGYIDPSFLNGQNYIFGNSTTTNATSTNSYTSGTASSTTLNANTASVGALSVGSCSGCGAPNTAVTVFPRSTMFSPAATTTRDIDANTVMKLAQVQVPFPINVNKLSFQVGDNINVAGTVDFTLYSEDGQTQYFSVTTASLGTVNATSSVAISNVHLDPGNYYIGVNANGTADLRLVSQAFKDTSVTATKGLVIGYGDLGAGEPKMYGELTISAGTPPATFDPTALTNTTVRNELILFFRLDN